MNSKDETSLQDELNAALLRSGLEGWTVALVPDPSQGIRGRVLVEEKTILIFAVRKVEILKTFVHEVIEIVMAPVFSQYRNMVNHLIEAFEKNIYAEKERAIERLIPLIFENMLKELEEQGDLDLLE